MVEQAEREPTMEEIVVALRETRQGARRLPHAPEDGRRAERERVVPFHHGRMHAPGDADEIGDPTDPVALRDQEIERLLAENARLNERVMFLLKVVERERARTAGAGGGDMAAEAARAAIARDVRRALDAELRPVLQALLRLLEKQQDAPPAHYPEAAPREPRYPAEPGQGRPAAAMPRASAASEGPAWLPSLLARIEGERAQRAAHEPAGSTGTAQPSMARGMGRILDALRL